MVPTASRSSPSTPSRWIGETRPYPPTQTGNNHLSPRHPLLRPIETHQRCGFFGGEQTRITRTPDVPATRILHDKEPIESVERVAHGVDRGQEVTGEDNRRLVIGRAKLLSRAFCRDACISAISLVLDQLD